MRTWALSFHRVCLKGLVSSVFVTEDGEGVEVANLPFNEQWQSVSFQPIYIGSGELKLCG